MLPVASATRTETLIISGVMMLMAKQKTPVKGPISPARSRTGFRYAGSGARADRGEEHRVLAPAQEPGPMEMAARRVKPIK